MLARAPTYAAQPPSCDAIHEPKSAGGTIPFLVVGTGRRSLGGWPAVFAAELNLDAMLPREVESAIHLASRC